MKKFLLKTGLFTVLLLGVLNAVGALLIRQTLQGHAVENSRIYHCLDKARRDWPQAEVFVFGDSVANQMYPPESTNDRIVSLAMVMPSTLAGQYFLLRRLAESTSLEKKEVVILLLPGGFQTKFGHDPTFHYVLKPFHNSEFRPWEDSYYMQHVGNSIIAASSQIPMLKCSNWRPPQWTSYLSPEPSFSKGAVSPLAQHYLREIESFCHARGASLRILYPAPSGNRSKIETTVPFALVLLRSV